MREKQTSKFAIRFHAILFMVTLWVHAFASSTATAQVPDEHTILNSPYYLGPQTVHHKVPVPTFETGSNLTRNEWQDLIDRAWGPSPLSSAERLLLFDEFWHMVDVKSACFQGIDVDWDLLYVTYQREAVEAGISRGRFAAIMNHLAIALRESHTVAVDHGVSWSMPEPGIPLLVVGGWGNCGHVGAGLTPIRDGGLLVYDAVSPHPLGLEPGDIVLGYDGVPWSVLVEQLLEAKLPLAGWWIGSSPSSFEHSVMMSAGMNWHLFETMDVIKHKSGAKVGLPVDPLIGNPQPIFCSEQLDIPGVPKPDFENQHVVGWGIMDGTQIGYIYVWGWMWDAESAFRSAVKKIMNNYQTDGLIIDFRMNYGGNMYLSNLGLKWLFNQTVETINFARRRDPNDHLSMEPLPGSPSTYSIPGDPSSYYDHPIAVLVGPGAVSSGDQVALRMKFHPRARFFGKSTSTAFNSPQNITNHVPADWNVAYPPYEAYLLRYPGEYLTHDEFPVDVEVWLEADDVAVGKDTVVEAAVAWIEAGG